MPGLALHLQRPQDAGDRYCTGGGTAAFYSLSHLIYPFYGGLCRECVRVCPSPAPAHGPCDARPRPSLAEVREDLARRANPEREPATAEVAGTGHSWIFLAFGLIFYSYNQYIVYDAVASFSSSSRNRPSSTCACHYGLRTNHEPRQVHMYM